MGRPRRAEPGCGLREARGYTLKRQGGWVGTEDGVRYDPNLNPLKKTDRQIRLEGEITLQKRENRNRKGWNTMSVALRVRAWI